MRASTQTQRTNLRRGALALACAVSLAALPACSLGPVDLDALMGNGTSVAEAKAAARAARSTTLTADELHTAGTLTVGLLSSESAPLLLSSADEGLDVDVAYALADELGVDCAFVSVTGLSDAYDACDVVMGVRAGDDVDTAVAGSYAEDAMALFSRASSGTKATAADLAGKTVGVQAGSVSQRALASAGTQAAEQDFTNLNEAFAALEAGTVDYVLCGAYPGGYLAAVYDGISCVGTLAQPAYLGVGVKAENNTLFSKVLEGMDVISSNGVLDVLRGRWVGGMSRLDTTSVIDGIQQADANVDEQADADAEADADAGTGTEAGTASTSTDAA